MLRRILIVYVVCVAIYSVNTNYCRSQPPKKRTRKELDDELYRMKTK